LKRLAKVTVEVGKGGAGLQGVSLPLHEDVHQKTESSQNECGTSLAGRTFDREEGLLP